VTARGADAVAADLRALRADLAALYGFADADIAAW